ncbi:hypothetical protein QNH28_13135 [Paenibacillus sp. G2S3]|uniref:hypothetical protein n=1 Tax=Paenibacillus sp. G2S3 TaxID=3047872 RepID=UPI0024C1C0C9|nr:hypothetical protein [Paenibacillus sp. G2S3]WHY21864.1 hypothetical protein QNH28_13135 [Paenibacillus sp. G2S3]
MNSPSQPPIALTYSQQSIIASRVTIPKQASYYVQRTRLMSKFMDENRAKVTLIAASAGFGKTTLAAEWGRVSMRMKWLGYHWILQIIISSVSG